MKLRIPSVSPQYYDYRNTLQSLILDIYGILINNLPLLLNVMRRVVVVKRNL